METNNSRFTTYLQNLIAKGYTDEALHLLNKYASEEHATDEKINNDVIILSNQYFDYQNKEQLGMPVQYEQKNRVIFAVLNILDSIAKSSANDNIDFFSEELQDDIQAIELNIKEKQKKKILIKLGVAGGISGAVILALVATNVLLSILATIVIIVGSIIIIDRT